VTAATPMLTVTVRNGSMPARRASNGLPGGEICKIERILI
jgi:hypothetical protein